MRKGIWTDNGFFNLADAWTQPVYGRTVFKFRLEVTDRRPASYVHIRAADSAEGHSRVIPGDIKLEVWRRDRGQSKRCGATDELHFDHILPYSKGGTSLTAENIQLLCARHNLQKSAKIE